MEGTKSLDCSAEEPSGIEVTTCIEDLRQKLYNEDSYCSEGTSNSAKGLIGKDFES